MYLTLSMSQAYFLTEKTGSNIYDRYSLVHVKWVLRFLPGEVRAAAGSGRFKTKSIVATVRWAWLIHALITC